MSGDQIEFNLRIKLMREALNRWRGKHQQKQTIACTTAG